AFGIALRRGSLDPGVARRRAPQPENTGVLPPTVPSGKRCRARTVRGTCTPMTSWRQFQANRLDAYRAEDGGRQARTAPQCPPAWAHRRDRDRRLEVEDY